MSRISVTSLIQPPPREKAVDALAGQSAKLLNGIPIDEEDFFGRQLAFNMLPLLPDSEGSVREERRIVDEVRKILQDERADDFGKRRPGTGILRSCPDGQL
ncbi:Asd/ArgC dimerization domain-containing protein [Shigella flexneri]